MKDSICYHLKHCGRAPNPVSGAEVGQGEEDSVQGALEDMGKGI
jgi:hypothetical protein